MRPAQTTDNTEQTTTSSRRTFLGTMTGAAVAAGTVGFAPTAQATPSSAAGPNAAATPTPRAQAALKLRQDAAKAQINLGQATHVSNGDEARFGNKIGSYSKGLPHNSLGEVSLSAYN